MPCTSGYGRLIERMAEGLPVRLDTPVERRRAARGRRAGDDAREARSRRRR